MATTRYDPFTRFTTLRDAIDRMFDDTFGRSGTGRTGSGMLPIDMFERQDDLIIMAAVPGARPEDVEISVSSETLTIRATVHTEAERDNATDWTWYFHELDHGGYSRSISLPFPVAADQADARFENGILHLRLPKSAEARSKRIQVRAGGRAQPIGAGQTSGQLGEPRGGQTGTEHSMGGQTGRSPGDQPGGQTGGRR